jgi:hypothetical protein
MSLEPQKKQILGAEQHRCMTIPSAPLLFWRGILKPLLMMMITDVSGTLLGVPFLPAYKMGF